MAKHRIRRWFQFGVLDLLLLMTIAAVVVVLWQPPRITTHYDPLAEGMQAGQHWAGNGLRMKFRWCPAGEFKMGEPPNQVDVTLSHGFWLGKYEVTQGEYRQVMNDSPGVFPLKGRDGTVAAGVDSDRVPVTGVPWEEAVKFCRVFTEQERKAARLPPGWEYRLPTEAQWEYGCRAGTQTAYSFGDDASRLVNFAWFTTNSEWRLHAVGEKPPNPWGLHDMHGNLAEWCIDWYAKNLRGGTDPEVEVTGPAYQPSRLCRGGSWINDATSCRSANRGAAPPVSQVDTAGFRVALVMSRE